MQADRTGWPDWRDSGAYAVLRDADRPLLAWEWLRRDPQYCAAARQAFTRRCRSSASAGAGAFGLEAFEPASLGVPDARPLWRSDAEPSVLRVGVMPELLADRFDMARLGPLARIVLSDRGEHLLLSDGLCAIRLDGPEHAFTAGAVGLRYDINGLLSAELPVLTLQRFLALCRTGRFSRTLHSREARAGRWILELRAHDALAAGAGQRAIAAALLSDSALEPGWRVREPSLRSRVQRLVRSARRMHSGGWRGLLAPAACARD